MPSQALIDAMLPKPGVVGEEENFRQMQGRDPANAAQIGLMGSGQHIPAPYENLKVLLSMLPVTGNVMAAKDAYDNAGDVVAASKAGDIRGQRKAAAMTGLSLLGAMSPLPWGSTAGRVAKEAKEVAPAFPAWHGSPHDFDEFKLDKIGTGEGAQAYGHGLYFAQNPAVAREYRDTLAATRELNLDGKPIADDLYRSYASAKMQGADLSEQLAHQMRLAEYNRAVYRQRAEMGIEKPTLLQAAQEHENNANAIRAVMAGEVSGPKGRLYHTEIDSEPEHLLDWDVRFERQPPKVQEALGKLPQAQAMLEQNRLVDGLRARLKELAGQRATPESLPEREVLSRRLLQEARKAEELDNAFHDYRAWTRTPEDAATLRAAGIPGIRYLDQGSRGADGAGTSNYVIFDDKLVKILGKE